MRCGLFLLLSFIMLTINLLQSGKSVSYALALQSIPGLFVIIRSIHESFARFLKHIGFFTIFSRKYDSQNSSMVVELSIYNLPLKCCFHVTEYFDLCILKAAIEDPLYVFYDDCRSRSVIF